MHEVSFMPAEAPTRGVYAVAVGVARRGHRDPSLFLCQQITSRAFSSSGGAGEVSHDSSSAG